MTDLNFESFKQRVFKCEKCIRLTKFRKLISQKKRKSYLNQKYFGKQIVGYGKLNAQILLADSERNYILSQFNLLKSIGLLNSEYLKIR